MTSSCSARTSAASRWPGVPIAMWLQYRGRGRRSSDSAEAGSQVGGVAALDVRAAARVVRVAQRGDRRDQDQGVVRLRGGRPSAVSRASAELSSRRRLLGLGSRARCPSGRRCRRRATRRRGTRRRQRRCALRARPRRHRYCARLCRRRRWRSSGAAPSAPGLRRAGPASWLAGESSAPRRSARSSSLRPHRQLAGR